MRGHEDCRARLMDVGDLDLVMEWRNHYDIKRFMLSQHEITSGEHRSWFNRASNDSSKRLLIIEERGIPVGFVQFSDVVSGGTSYWGIYAAPNAPKGAGMRVGSTALDYAFRDLRVHKICGQALVYNEASIRLHRRLGFQQEGILREQYRINNIYHNLICFGLLADEWSQQILV